MRSVYTSLLLVLMFLLSAVSQDSSGSGCPSALHSTSTRKSDWLSIVGNTVKMGRAILRNRDYTMAMTSC